MSRSIALSLALFLLLTAENVAILAQTPTVAQALVFKPLQNADVVYDTPSGDELKICEVQSASEIGQSGWIVIDGSRRLLRRFVDTKKDGKIDQWCYYKDGLEVYRDMDTDGDGEADTCGWMGPAGVRQGKDIDADTKIDRWERISAEEVTSELVKALSTNDAKRFQALLPSEKEIDALNVGSTVADALKKQVRNSLSAFKKQGSKVLGRDANWVHFGGTRPALFPDSTLGSKADLVMYENVVALVDDGGDTVQLAVGTLLKIGDSWRTIDMPEKLVAGKAPGVGGFFTDLILGSPDVGSGEDNEKLQDMQKLITDFTRLQEKLTDADATKLSKKELASLNAEWADVTEELFEIEEKSSEKANWALQFVETIATAHGEGAYPKGLDRIESFLAKVESGKKLDKRFLGNIKFRWMNIVHNQQVFDEDRDGVEVQEKWKQNLDSFVAEYSSSDKAADAMLELGLLLEFEAANETDKKKSAQLDEKAEQWYQKIVKNHRDSPIVKKAAGAIRRINSIGRPIDMSGKTIDGSSLSLADAKGKIVVLHYWATYCDLCVEEMGVIDDLVAKYGKRGFQPIGINIDSDMDKLKKFVKDNELKWPHMQSAGGVDGELASELGILVLPTTFLIDRDGKVVSRRINAMELEDEIKELLKSE